jgi:transcriptional regulator of arginine metabolism
LRLPGAAGLKRCHVRIVHRDVDRRLGKAERQRLVLSLVERQRLGTQHELLEALASAGCRVTQATVSRDIRELGLEKVPDAFGRPAYARPGTPRVDPRETLQALLGQFGRRAVAAQNIVVVQSEIGSAPAIARALDRTEHPLVVGTLAGDDTCLVITADARRARSLAADLSQLVGRR